MTLRLIRVCGKLLPPHPPNEENIASGAVLEAFSSISSNEGNTCTLNVEIKQCIKDTNCIHLSHEFIFATHCQTFLASKNCMHLSVWEKNVSKTIQIATFIWYRTIGRKEYNNTDLYNMFIAPLSHTCLQ